MLPKMSSLPAGSCGARGFSLLQRHGLVLGETQKCQLSVGLLSMLTLAWTQLLPPASDVGA